MANSNYRIKDYNTVHHLVSRIAHRVYFLKDEERNDFIEMMRRAAFFCGIELVGWCIMTNHFHILVYLPPRTILDEETVLKRYAALKGASAASAMALTFSRWRQSGEAGETLVRNWLEKVTCRMYDIGNYMKILKQWFTSEYNRRHSHKGTLWEASYHDRPVSRSGTELAKCLAYIHLNPVRAAATPKYDGYAWSSYAAFCRGDYIAIKGMRFVYGDMIGTEEISTRHEILMDSLLEAEKRRRAEDIARKRAAGYELPTDALTDEAMVAQAAAHLEEVRSASVALREERISARRLSVKHAAQEASIISMLSVNPQADIKDFAQVLEVSPSTMYRTLKRMIQKGLIEHCVKGGQWVILRK